MMVSADRVPVCYADCCVLDSHDGPGDPRGLVGHCESDQLGRVSLQQLGSPGMDLREAAKPPMYCRVNSTASWTWGDRAP
jgi:hypothetical protein